MASRAQSGGESDLPEGYHAPSSGLRRTDSAGSGSTLPHPLFCKCSFQEGLSPLDLYVRISKDLGASLSGSAHSKWFISRGRKVPARGSINKSVESRESMVKGPPSTVASPKVGPGIVGGRRMLVG